MIESKMTHGILALIDIKNFREQSTLLGKENAVKYSRYFKGKIKHIIEPHEFNIVHSMEDALLIFGINPEGMLEIMQTLFLFGKLENRFGFVPHLRIVAHSGFFSLKLDYNTPIGIDHIRALDAFRLLLDTHSWESFITHSLYTGIKHLLKGKHVSIDLFQYKNSFIGFDNEEWFPPFYRISFTNQVTGVFEHLEFRTEKLKRDVRFIPVIGDIYPPVLMEKNFLNIFLENTLPRLSLPNNIDTHYLYENIPQAIIIGLPGSGKTTILHNFAYKDFIANETKPINEKQIVLYIPCKDALSNDEWLSHKYGLSPGKTTLKHALAILTRIFLFGKTVNDDLNLIPMESFDSIEIKIETAFNENRLTILLDGLEETPNVVTREKIKELVSILISQNTSNKIYLTARSFETDYFSNFSEKLFPILKISNLSTIQIKTISQLILDKESSIYKQFEQACKEEIEITSIMTTSFNALLLISYFNSFGRFDTRFIMYDTLIKSMLLDVWSMIKINSFNYDDLAQYFTEIKKPDYLERKRDTQLLYDSLSYFCFKFIYDNKYKVIDNKDELKITNNDLKSLFSKYIRENWPGLDEASISERSEKWIEQLCANYILILNSKNVYSFFHQEIIEYLAANYLVERRRRKSENFVSLVKDTFKDESDIKLNTLPIAFGSDMLTGFSISEILKESYDPDLFELSFDFCLSCVAELENGISKAIYGLPEKLKQSWLKSIERNLKSIDWIYLFLEKYILNSDIESLKKILVFSPQKLKLSMPTFLDDYLEKHFDALKSGDPELVDIRKKVLLRFIPENTIKNWPKKTRINKNCENKNSNNLLQLDAIGQEPNDKNYNYYKNLIGNELSGFFGSPNFMHSGWVRYCIVTANSKYIISASSDNTLKMWDIETGKELRTFFGHNDSVLSCALSPDGKQLFSASSDTSLIQWNLENGSIINKFISHKSQVNHCTISPDGRIMASASTDRTLKIWDIKTGMEINTLIGHDASVKSCTFTPDGKYLLSASDDMTLILWSIKSGKKIRSFEGHSASVNDCTISTKGTFCVSASDDGTLKIWEINTGKEIFTLIGHTGPVLNCTVTPDDRYIISASFDKTLKLWNIETGNIIRTYRGHSAPVSACAVTSDGNYLVSASFDDSIKKWKLDSSAEILPFFRHRDSVLGCVINETKDMLISSSIDKTLILWNMKNGAPIYVLTGHLSSVNNCIVSPDGKIIISASDDKTLKSWDTQTGKEILTYYGHRDSVANCVFFEDGKKFISASFDNSLKLWDIGITGEILSFEGHSGIVYTCALSMDGKFMVSGSDDSTLKLWDMKGMIDIDSSKPHEIERAMELRTFIGHESSILDCVISNDGKQIVSASRDKTLKLWNIETGETLRTFIGHLGPIFGCAISNDGAYIVSVSNDKTLKIWDIDSGKILKSIAFPWIPRRIVISKSNPGALVIANLNGTLTHFTLDILKKNQK